MKTLLKGFIALLVLAVSAAVGFGQTTFTRINPVDDGSIYNPGTINEGVFHNSYVVAAAGEFGAMLFSPFDSSGYSTISLALNPYALPIWDLSVDVYGYNTITGSTLQAEDYFGKGTFLGTLDLSSSTGYGQDASLDITSFVKSNSSNYFGFILDTTNTDVFSSLEYNYGHPSGLIASAIPEPSTYAAMFGAAVLLIAFLRRRKPAQT